MKSSPAAARSARSQAGDLGQDPSVKERQEISSRDFTSNISKPNSSKSNHRTIRNEKEEKKISYPPHHSANDPLKKLSFPAKIHAMLSRSDFTHIISWMPHGRSWRINKPREFERTVIPIYFTHCKYNSFVRMVNGWGFQRIKKGPDRNSYFHEFFLRGRLELCQQMMRPNKQEKKTSGKAQKDPDLYARSAIDPLPEVSYEEDFARAGMGDSNSLAQLTASATRNRARSISASAANETRRQRHVEALQAMTLGTVSNRVTDVHEQLPRSSLPQLGMTLTSRYARAAEDAEAGARNTDPRHDQDIFHSSNNARQGALLDVLHRFVDSDRVLPQSLHENHNLVHRHHSFPGMISSLVNYRFNPGFAPFRRSNSFSGVAFNEQAVIPNVLNPRAASSTSFGSEMPQRSQEFPIPDPRVIPGTSPSQRGGSVRSVGSLPLDRLQELMVLHAASGLFRPSESFMERRLGGENKKDSVED